MESISGGIVKRVRRAQTKRKNASNGSIDITVGNRFSSSATSSISTVTIGRLVMVGAVIVAVGDVTVPLSGTLA